MSRTGSSGVALLGQRPLSPLVRVPEIHSHLLARAGELPLMAMFGVGYTELIVVMVIVLVLFGHRLPSVMRSMGRGIKEFKEGINDDSSVEDDEDVKDTKASGPYDKKP